MRWTKLDPISFKAGDKNLYPVTFNSPIRPTDPSGLLDWRIAAEGAATGSLLAGAAVIAFATATVSVPVLVGVGIAGGVVGGTISGAYATNDLEALSFGAYAGLAVGFFTATILNNLPSPPPPEDPNMVELTTRPIWLWFDRLFK